MTIIKDPPLAPSTKEIWSHVERKLTYERKLITFTHQVPTETKQSTPTPLPTAKPSTPQKTITITSGMLPTFDAPLDDIKYQIAIWVGGRNTDTVSRYVYVDIALNGVTVISSSKDVGAGYYWTFSGFVSGVKVGDVIGIYLWASATTVNWAYDAYQVQVMSVLVCQNELLFDVSFESEFFNLVNPYAYSVVCESRGLVCSSQGFGIAIVDSTRGRAPNIFPIDKVIETYYGGYHRNWSIILATSNAYCPWYIKQACIRRLGVVK